MYVRAPSSRAISNSKIYHTFWIWLVVIFIKITFTYDIKSPNQLYYLLAIVDAKENHDNIVEPQIKTKARQDRDSSWEGKVLRNLEIISESKAVKKRQEEYKNQWKLAGAALDRLCIVLFLITIVATLGFVFNTAPQITL